MKTADWDWAELVIILLLVVGVLASSVYISLRRAKNDKLDAISISSQTIRPEIQAGFYYSLEVNNGDTELIGYPINKFKIVKK